MNIEITKVGEKGESIEVVAPYEKKFIDFAHMQGAKWVGSRKAWSFPARAEQDIHKALKEIFGFGPDVEKGIVKISIPKVRDAEVRCAGRAILTKFHRDYRPKVGEGVRILSGDVPESGGSMKHPSINADDLVVEVADFPLDLLKAAQEENPDWGFEIVEKTETAPDSPETEMWTRIGEARTSTGTFFIYGDAKGEKVVEEKDIGKITNDQDQIGVVLRNLAAPTSPFDQYGAECEILAKMVGGKVEEVRIVFRHR